MRYPRRVSLWAALYGDEALLLLSFFSWVTPNHPAAACTTLYIQDIRQLAFIGSDGRSLTSSLWGKTSCPPLGPAHLLTSTDCPPGLPREKRRQKNPEADCGETWLFFGCRHRDRDFLFRWAVFLFKTWWKKMDEKKVCVSRANQPVLIAIKSKCLSTKLLLIFSHNLIMLIILFEL